MPMNQCLPCDWTNSQSFGSTGIEDGLSTNQVVLLAAQVNQECELRVASGGLVAAIYMLSKHISARVLVDANVLVQACSVSFTSAKRSIHAWSRLNPESSLQDGDDLRAMLQGPHASLQQCES